MRITPRTQAMNTSQQIPDGNVQQRVSPQQLDAAARVLQHWFARVLTDRVVTQSADYAVRETHPRNTQDQQR
jgi:hypothetical protein